LVSKYFQYSGPFWSNSVSISSMGFVL